MKFNKGFNAEVRNQLIKQGMTAQSIKDNAMINRIKSSITRDFVDLLHRDGLFVVVRERVGDLYLVVEVGVHSWLTLSDKEKADHHAWVQVHSKAARLANVKRKPYFRIGNYLFTSEDDYRRKLAEIVDGRRLGKPDKADSFYGGQFIKSSRSIEPPSEVESAIIKWLKDKGIKLEVTSFVKDLTPGGPWGSNDPETRNEITPRPKYTLVVTKNGEQPYHTTYWMGAQMYYYNGVTDAYKDYVRENDTSFRGEYTELYSSPNLFVKDPRLSDIFYSMVMDRTRGETFSEWCSNIGYDEDSRKAFDTYHACQEAESQLNRWFNHTELEELEELLQDY